MIELIIFGIILGIPIGCVIMGCVIDYNKIIRQNEDK
jgi:hypothetical protein